MNVEQKIAGLQVQISELRQELAQLQGLYRGLRSILEHRPDPNATAKAERARQLKAERQARWLAKQKETSA